ncbi:unnamed protein product, partial [Ectocarpus sp. 12 AP-2014]
QETKHQHQQNKSSLTKKRYRSIELNHPSYVYHDTKIIKRKQHTTRESSRTLTINLHTQTTLSKVSGIRFIKHTYEVCDYTLCNSLSTQNHSSFGLLFAKQNAPPRKHIQQAISAGTGSCSCAGGRAVPTPNLNPSHGARRRRVPPTQPKTELPATPLLCFLGRRRILSSVCCVIFRGGGGGEEYPMIDGASRWT